MASSIPVLLGGGGGGEEGKERSRKERKARKGTGSVVEKFIDA